jgi:hypothetical protein
MTWHGWIWSTKRQRWEHACEAEGLAACSHRLGEIARLRKVKDADSVLTGGAAPSFQPRPRTHGYAQEATSQQGQASQSLDPPDPL